MILLAALVLVMSAEEELFVVVVTISFFLGGDDDGVWFLLLFSGFLVVFRAGLDGGMPNLAGSVNGVAGNDANMGGSVAALGRRIGVVVIVVLLPFPEVASCSAVVGIGGMDDDGTATRVRLAALGGLLELLFRPIIISCTTELCFRFKLLNFASRSRGFRS